MRYKEIYVMQGLVAPPFIYRINIIKRAGCSAIGCMFVYTK
jgi:hypothetical protein